MTTFSIKNQTKNTTIIVNARLANNFITRTVGLLNKNKLEQNEGLIISPCKSIHSIGMKFNFDAVFIDKQNKVVYLVEAMNPYRISPCILKSSKVIELKSGTIKLANIEINDILEIIPNA